MHWSCGPAMKRKLTDHEPCCRLRAMKVHLVNRNAERENEIGVSETGNKKHIHQTPALKPELLPARASRVYRTTHRLFLYSNLSALLFEDTSYNPPSSAQLFLPNPKDTH